MAAERTSIEVWADWLGLVAPALMGVLHATPARGKHVFSFEYARTWLESDHPHTLDPALVLYRGPQYPPAARANFGLFLDSSPDRWGRVLLQRREAQRARAQKRKERRLHELDFLLGVYDGHRMGGLRFRFPDGPFLDDDTELASPPWTSLRELEHASAVLERDPDEDDPEVRRWIRLLIAPGRSLGGARPKASVLDGDKRLWIAKFPSIRDADDVGAWEGVLHMLAERAGIVVPKAIAKRFGTRHHTFLSARFDRRAGGARVHFCSAMTMLEKEDGDGGSYLELASVIAQRGAHPSRDLEQLWRRIVFNVAVSNVDDHLRNHGFLLEDRGWSLAPAYDLNPNASGDGLTLDISETDNALDLTLVREVSKHFRIKAARADAIVEEVLAAVRTWRDVASAHGLETAAQERMRDAFRVADAS
jgi:serine/threonine-protein kinase HipA